jgi:ubiquinol-cytochrome c reductase cytochrome b subunit
MLRKTLTAAARWLDDRLGLSDALGPMLRHLVPPDARWWYVFGSATMCAFMIQVVSGVALAFGYIPSATDAYPTLQFITHDAPFGHFLRGLHYFGASAMVLMIGLHMAQTFLFGSYKFPREMNWVTGVLLLGFTLVMGFTGQLLRWDQTAVWSVVVAAEQARRIPFIGGWVARFTLGGETIGGATLNRFFAIHVFIMPALMFAFIGLHVLLVLRHGIAEPPRAGEPVDPKTYRADYQARLKKSGKPFWPDAAWRDVVFAVGMIVAIALLAVIFGPPELGKPPDPSIVAADPRPDWYLLWYFAILALLPHGTEQIFMVFGPLTAGLLLIVLPFIAPSGERSPRHRPWAVAGILLTVTAIAALWVVGKQSPWSPNFDPGPLPAAVIGATHGPVFAGAQLFQEKSCLNCHLIHGQGGRRGPDLTFVGDKLRESDMIIRIVNGGVNMPAFGATLKADEITDLVAFLKSRTRH